MPQGRIKFDGEPQIDAVRSLTWISPSLVRHSAWFSPLGPLLAALLTLPHLRANLFAFLYFHVHITMRGEASWQTSITSTHTRIHSQKNARARKHSCQQADCHVGLQIDHEPSARYIRRHVVYGCPTSDVEYDNFGFFFFAKKPRHGLRFGRRFFSCWLSSLADWANDDAFAFDCSKYDEVSFSA